MPNLPRKLLLALDRAYEGEPPANLGSLVVDAWHRGRAGTWWTDITNAVPENVIDVLAADPAFCDFALGEALAGLAVGVELADVIVASRAEAAMVLGLRHPEPGRFAALAQALLPVRDYDPSATDPWRIVPLRLHARRALGRLACAGRADHGNLLLAEAGAAGRTLVDLEDLVAGVGRSLGDAALGVLDDLVLLGMVHGGLVEALRCAPGGRSRLAALASYPVLAVAELAASAVGSVPCVPVGPVEDGDGGLIDLGAAGGPVAALVHADRRVRHAALARLSHQLDENTQVSENTLPLLVVAEAFDRFVQAAGLTSTCLAPVQHALDRLPCELSGPGPQRLDARVKWALHQAPPTLPQAAADLWALGPAALARVRGPWVWSMALLARARL